MAIDLVSVSSLKPLVAPAGGMPGGANPRDAAAFSELVSGSQAPSLVQAVEKAQDKIQQVDMNISAKLREFNAKDHVVDLVEAMHASSMRAVSVQLTGKVGSKVSESFEQLIKQQ